MSAEIAKNYDSRLRYFKGKETIPLYAARNKAMEQVKGDFIAFLDCDDSWMPEKLERQIPLFNDPEVGLVFCDVVYFNRKGDDFRLYDKVTFCRGMCFRQLLKNYFLSIPSVVIRKNALDQEAEWFDPRFHLVGDFDLFLRPAYSSKIDMCRDALAKYRVHGLSSSWTKNDLWYKELSILLDKFCDLWPNFTDKYSNYLKIHLCYKKALYLWNNREAKAARNCLHRYRFKNLKVLMLYFASFFPSAYLLRITDKFRKVVRPEGFYSQL